jgi:hypothetical protein
LAALGVFALGGQVFFLGAATLCWAILLPITTKALPISSPVPWIVA